MENMQGAVSTAPEEAASASTENLDQELELDYVPEKRLKVTKQMIWERKLLDFSLRNNLLNLKVGKRVIPFVSFQIDHLEDKLQAGETYQVMPAPVEGMSKLPEGCDVFDSARWKADCEEQVLKDLDNKKLYAYLTESELASGMKFLYRTSRTALEENGANSLFVVLGVLRWFESERSDKARYAPLLLLPVDIIRKGGAAGYVIRTRDEEMMLNITLMELMKQQCDVTFQGLDPLPKDESGIDVRLVLDTIRKGIAGLNRWEVLEESMIGLFSFSKFVMWNDIHSNAEKLKDNSVLASLMEGKVKWVDDKPAADARALDADGMPSDYAIPVDVDSSQLEAVVDSGEGKTFILYGPPGTGKSQTITNMIANALFQGKRVLFVAEKMAALSVVEKRLSRIGIAPFCLEMHSNKATKTHFLAQMKEAMEAVHIAHSEDWEKTAQALFERRKTLNAYMEALHHVQTSGYSLYDHIAAFLAIDDARELLADEAVMGPLTRDRLEDAAQSLRDLDTVFQITGHPSAHALLGLEPHEASLGQLPQLQAALTELAVAYADLAGVVQTNEQFQTLHQAVDVCGRRDAVSKQLLTTFLPGFLEQNVVALRQAWKAAEQKWFLPRFFAKRAYMKQLRAFNAALQEGEVAAVLDQLDAYQQANAEFQGLQSALALGDAHPWARTASVEQRANKALQSVEALADCTVLKSWPVGEVAPRVQAWLANFGKLKDWCQWVFRKRQLVAAGMAPVVSAIETQGLSGAVASQALLRGMHHQGAERLVASDASLQMFNGMIFEDTIAKYKQLTGEFQQISKKELYCRLAARVPSLTMEAAASSEVGILKRNIANGGRGVSIRRIIDQIPSLLPKLCPCMLMSPISVAQYIDLNSDKFDIVIFDEASQMPTSEAVGAIARGKSLIVVGDPKQMPPTSFFATSSVDDDEAEIDDMESILDDCISLSIPGRYLSWHYRSKHESLIAFSNSQYYDGQLNTFPSVDDRQSKVRFIPVDGVYDKGKSRSNRAEAEAIVAEVLRRLADAELSKRSIGIVSFSKVQQDLIEDILVDELAKHPELETLAYQCEEPVFVKNLENVQGDERDVILFSVGYGPDAQGNVSMNFGPLNNKGGERRLNVAVSRARYEMLIFSTLRPEQIDLSRTQAKGVEGLKKFLEFAQRGKSPDGMSQSKALQGNEMIMQIADVLKSHGYDVDVMVGRSNFKVDLAVVNPKQPDTYLLGILCDGKKYYETKTARDREIVQPNVLTMLRWNICRVWTMDWFDHSDKVIERLLETLKKLQEGKPEGEKVQGTNSASPKNTPVVGQKTAASTSAPAASTSAPAASTSAPVNSLLANEKIIEVHNECQKEYAFAVLAHVKGGNLEKLLANPAKVRTQIRSIVQIEQPITNTLLYKRVAALWEVARVTPRLQAMIDEQLLVYEPDNRFDKQVVYWLDEASMKNYPYYRVNSERDIQDIPLVEVMNAAHYVMEQQLAIPVEDLKKLTASVLGFARRGANLELFIQTAIEKLVESGALILENDRVKWVK